MQKNMFATDVWYVAVISGLHCLVVSMRLSLNVGLQLCCNSVFQSPLKIGRKAALQLRSGVLPLEGRNWISCVKKD